MAFLSNSSKYSASGSRLGRSGDERGSSTTILRLSLEALAAGVDQPDYLPLLVHDVADFSSICRGLAMAPY
jgi:hypothetical protein